MKKKSLILIIIGLVLIACVSIALFFFSDSSKKDDKEDIDNFDKTPWKLAYGEEFSNSSYKLYDEKDFSEISFNEIKGERKSLYTVLIPKDAKIEKIKNNMIYYKSDNVKILCQNSEVDNLDLLLKVIYDDINSDADKTAVFQKNYNGLIVVKAMGDSDGGTDRYVETLSIYKTTEVNDYIYYSSVEYSLSNERFSDDTIKELVKGFEVKEGQAKDDFCDQSGNQYKCEFEVSALNQGSDNFKITIPKENYDLSFYNSIAFFPIIVKTGQKDNDKYKRIDIQVIYSKGKIVVEDLVDIDYDGDAKETVVTINNKKFTKVYSGSNKASYVYEIDDSKALRFNVKSYENDTDKLMEAVTNFEFN